MKNMQKQEPLISVIVPTLNEEVYLSQLLLSIKNQTYSNVEVVISDDGSMDNTRAIAKEYGARVVVNPKIGEFKSRNVGAFHSKGEILVFTSADAIFPKDVLEKTVQEFMKDRNLVSIQRALIPYDGPLWAVIEYRFFYVLQKLRDMFLKHPTGSSTFTAVRKKCFFKAGGYQDRMSDDGLLIKRLTKIGKAKIFLDRFVPISARRMRKQGFIRFHNHFIHLLLGIFFPYSFLEGFSFYRNLLKARQVKHERSKGGDVI